ncbi:protein-disulfide reductase DsbD family protein [Flavobacterium terrisoli]|uniref:protein-disulfide reductase DsbD family protein n=1 Tax=Flavobacterium terrisoli TaxID=3242195 RepID=UPI0025439FDB|nr:thioredoxin family protein [Flavobacterium buctense]
MKKVLFFLLTFLAFANLNAQIVNPVKWTSKVEKISDTEFNLEMEGKIDDNWHMYSQFTPENGPLPAEFSFKDTKGNYELVGKVKETPYKKQYNEVFEVDEYYFDKKVKFTQKVKIINASLKAIKATIDYQVCKDVCINQDNAFTFQLPKIEKTSSDVAVTTVDTAKADTVQTAPTEVKQAPPAVVTEPEKAEDKGLWTIFIFALLGGFAATFTPCVYPMIPMTVSFFLKQSDNKSKGRFNAIFYGACIVFICFAITIPFHIFEGISRDIFSEISTNVYLNIFFFIIFVVFAISFFGAFEITMPSSLSNKVDRASDKGGLIGIFFMALTLIIVSFSCIGPALGFVFGTSLNSDGGALILSIAMLGFGFGLALPFMFFALTPNLLGNMPKSGGWLNTVKVVFGFIELALAFKFLSNADIGLDLHLLEREVFIAIWIAVFGALALYLFGKITLPHDSPLSHLSVGRMLLGVTSLAFAVYLVPGLWGAPLKLISAFPPPTTYSESPQGFGSKATVMSEDKLPDGAELAVHNLVSFTDYQTGLAYAKKVNKPIMIDFTGKQCVNCRLMENNVWSNEKVLEILKNDVVLISLYGDDKKELPKDEQYVTAKGKEINTIGKKWSEFQITRFNNNARPLYVLLDLNEKELNVPVAYTPDIEEYLTWLKDGISKFK